MQREKDDILEPLLTAFRNPNGVPDVTAVTRGLVHGLIASLAEAKDDSKNAWFDQRVTPGSTKIVKELLWELVDSIYLSPDGEENEEKRQRLLAEIPLEMREKAAVFLTRVSHLHQMASMMVREVLLEKNAKRDVVSTFLESSFGPAQSSGSWLDRKSPSALFEKSKTACDALSAPIMEFTFTAHPTNTNSLEFMRAQRQMVQAVEAWRKRPQPAERKTLMEAFRTFNSTPILPRKNKNITPLRVAEEVDYMLYALGNAYEGMKNIYQKFDAALEKKYHANYTPSDLHLKIRFHSWGSGDKDGNQNVNADTTLHALAKHRLAILVRYEKELGEMKSLPENLRPWAEDIRNAREIFAKYVKELDQKLTSGVFLGTEEADRIRAELVKASKGLNARAFEQELEGAYKDTKEKDLKLLNLLRHVRHFGFSLGFIEYRETAEEYQRIIAAVVAGYENMNEAGRTAALTEILQNPERLAALNEKLKNLAVAGQGKPYSKNDVAPIAYHTLKRMEIARDFPDMIAANVLAECQGISNMLEALVLQRAVTDHGRRPLMNIVPLFEEYKTLEKAPQVMEQVQKNEAYQQHLAELAMVGDEREKPQAQIAHSDNARRAGSIGSRVAIYEAQAKLKAIGVRCYQGGSQSDAYRDGVRSVSAKINIYGLHDFAKMTFQGGDLLNYFNDPHSIERLMVKNITASALALKRQSGPAMKATDEITPALKKMIPEYEKIFEDGTLSQLLEEAGYNMLQLVNLSSRASGRNANAAKVNIEQVRTISYSKTLQHAGFSPVLIGAEGLYEAIQILKGKEVTPKELNSYYKDSPLFREVMDRLLFALSRSSFTPLEGKLSPENIELLKRNYKDAYKVAMAAYTGKEPVMKGDDFKAMRQDVIRQVFPHVKEFFNTQDRLMRSAHQIRGEWQQEPVTNPMDFKILALAHNMMDTVHHGRNWLLDDPSAAALYCDVKKISRPHVSGASTSIV
ncbi:MAG: phosphoenolpyruvate carboxylase [Alphaproteobacteria bacterium]